MAPLLKLAEQIISQADSAHPADRILRLELKKRPRLSATEKTDIARSVFSYFRWLGWLAEDLSLLDRIARASELAVQFAKHPESFPASELVARAVPSWVENEIHITPEYARALQKEPFLWLRARPGQGGVLAQKLRDCRVFGDGPLAEVLQYGGNQDLFRRNEFHAGEFEVQDLSSQAVGLVCAPRPGEIWWDACAGEGGKMLHLSDLLANKGLIWAADRAEWRLRVLKRRAARARVFNYRAAIWNGRAKLPTKTRFDGVLLDAPCSGTGTWQRNPHARWTVTSKDLQELSLLQLELLSNAWSAVRPGGRLVYSVCSLARSETSEVAERFTASHSDCAPMLLANPLDRNSPPHARLSLWPQDFGGNGMFICAWERRSNA
jgi:16S rRNA (cytosine967-C5)-methyltransferase